jgi:uncharacterized membrane protein YqaE (UPF0057 family)
MQPLTRTFGSDVWINVALWIFGWIPGVIHAWYVSPSVVFLDRAAHTTSGGSSPSPGQQAPCEGKVLPFWVHVPYIVCAKPGRSYCTDIVSTRFASSSYHLYNNRGVKYYSFQVQKYSVLFLELSASREWIIWLTRNKHTPPVA